MPLSVEKLESAKRVIPNLRFVSEHVVRGGQPDAFGLKHLKEAGVETVVSLCGGQSRLISLFRASSAGSILDPELEEEKRAAQDLGMKWVQIPLDVFREPPEGAIQKFVQLISDPGNRPAFVHCQYGRDRTGLMMGVYRVSVDGWAVEKAYAEMIECGFDADRTNLSDALFAFAKAKSGG